MSGDLLNPDTGCCGDETGRGFDGEVGGVSTIFTGAVIVEVRLFMAGGEEGRRGGGGRGLICYSAATVWI